MSGEEVEARSSFASSELYSQHPCSLQSSYTDPELHYRLMQNAFELPDHEWVDVSAEFESALAELSMGQLIQHDAYSMMDLMSAIEVSDVSLFSYRCRS